MLLYFVWRRMIPVFPRTKNAFQIISTLRWLIYAADMLICQYVLICWYGAIMLIYFSQDRECRLLSRLLSALSWLRWLSVSEHQCNCDLDDCCDYYYYYHTPLLFAFFTRPNTQKTIEESHRTMTSQPMVVMFMMMLIIIMITI